MGLDLEQVLVQSLALTLLLDLLEVAQVMAVDQQADLALEIVGRLLVDALEEADEEDSRKIVLTNLCS